MVGAGADDPETWRALVALAERLGCPVWQESFSARAGFPQDHRAVRRSPAGRPRPPARRRSRRTTSCSPSGAPVFRQYPFIAGPFVEAGHDASRWSASDPAEVHRSAAELARAGAAGAGLRRARAASFRRATRHAGRAVRVPPPPPPPAAGEPLRAGHVFAAIAERLPRNAIVIEESPSNRPELLARLPAREPLGSLSPAMGGLGFALPAAIGLRMARPDRPVVAIVGDGSSLYSIQALWSAAHYRAGVLFVILANGGYAIMDRLAEQTGRHGAVAGLQRRRRGPRPRVRLPGAHRERARRAARDARRGAARPRRAATSRSCSRSRSPPTRRSRRDGSGHALPRRRAGMPASRSRSRSGATSRRAACGRASASGPSRSSRPSSASAGRRCARGCACSRARI